VEQGTVIESSADISKCGRFRWKLVRRWDLRPMLLVILFNPSTADALVPDPTITLLCHIASWNGYGGIVVANLCPLRSSSPDSAVEMMNTWPDRAHVAANEAFILEEAAKARSILFAWGALAARLGKRAASYAEILEGHIRIACPGAAIYCLGKTAEGYPIHPLARGKHKVPKDRKFVEWRTA
jgi:hypothetical protein